MQILFNRTSFVSRTDNDYKKAKKLQITLFSAFLITLLFNGTGCGPNVNSSEISQSSENKPTSSSKDSKTNENGFENSDINFESGRNWNEAKYPGKWLQAKVKSLKEEVLQNKRTEASQFRIVTDNNSNSNYAFYRIDGMKKDNVFTIPKLLVQSEVFGGRLKIINEKDGQTTIQFPIALIDGEKSNLSTGYSELPIPQTLIKNPNLEKKEVTEKSQTGTVCPDLIEFRQGDRSLNLSINFNEGGCARNQLFLVTTSAQSAEIKAWLEEYIPSNNVVIRAVFKPKAHFDKEVVSIDINGSLLYEKLYSHFVEGKFEDATLHLSKISWGVSELHEQLLRFFLQNFKEVGFQGLTNSEMNSVLDSVISKYFERSDLTCPVYPNICVKFKAKPDLAQNLIQFHFIRHESVEIAGDPIEISTSIRDLSQDVTPFKVEAEKTDDSHPPKEGRLAGSLKQLSPGDLVEIEIGEVLGLHREYSNAMYKEGKSKLKNIVCVKRGEPQTTEVTDYSQCEEWNQTCNLWRTCDAYGNPCVEWTAYCCRSVGHGDERCANLVSSNPSSWPGGYRCGSSHCSKAPTVCTAPLAPGMKCEPGHWISSSCKRYATKRVPTGYTPCIEEQNQWMKHFDLADPLSTKPVKENFASIDNSTLTTRLQLQFTSFVWNGSGEPKFIKTTCPISNFLPEIKRYQDKILIRFRAENHPENHCLPFNEQNSVTGFEPELALLNQLTVANQAPCGFREDFWDGKSIYTCPEINQTSDRIIFTTYYPRMEISGKLRMPGLQFVSQENRGEK